MHKVLPKLFPFPMFPILASSHMSKTYKFSRNTPIDSTEEKKNLLLGS